MLKGPASAHGTIRPPCNAKRLLTTHTVTALSHVCLYTNLPGSCIPTCRDLASTAPPFKIMSRSKHKIKLQIVLVRPGGHQVTRAVCVVTRSDKQQRIQMVPEPSNAQSMKGSKANVAIAQLARRCRAWSWAKHRQLISSFAGAAESILRHPETTWLY